MAFAFRSSTRWRGALATVSGLLYLALTVSALTCALRHGLTAACPHQAAAPAGHDHGAPPADPGEGHLSLCQCLDNLAAEPPAPLLAAAAVAPTLPLPAVAEAPLGVAPLHVPAPRGPPALHAA